MQNMIAVNGYEDEDRSIMEHDDLDIPLLRFSPHDVWTIRDALEGTSIMGEIGSGKTSGSAAAIARAFLRAGFGGLVLCAKPEERDLWEGYAAANGRGDDVVIFSPEDDERFNWIEYELKREGRGAGQTENLVEMYGKSTEIVGGKAQAVSSEPFWDHAAMEMVREAIDLLRLAKQDEQDPILTLDDVYRVITSAPRSLAEVDDEAWQRKSFCAQVIAAADRRAKASDDPVAIHDAEVAVAYWLEEFAGLADRTRSSIVAHFSANAKKLMKGTAWELLGTTTTITPEATYKDGKIIIVDLPLQEYLMVGKMVQLIWKFMWQRAVLRRDVRAYPRPVFLWADEAQNFISSFDFMYQAVARSARAATVYITQNLNNYHAVLGSNAHHDAQAFLGNLVTKIYHANRDHATNQWAADSIAQQWDFILHGNQTTGRHDDSMSGGFGEARKYLVEPVEFTRLRKGGPANDYNVDAIVLGGKIWRETGASYVYTTFGQK